MSIYQTRLTNLRRLLTETGSSQKSLAKRVGTHPAYISQILNRTPLPSGGSRGMGARLARQLEVAFDKPPGWMDRDHSNPMLYAPDNATPHSSTPDNRIADDRATYQAQSPALKNLLAVALALTEQELETATVILRGLLASRDKTGAS